MSIKQVALLLPFVFSFCLALLLPLDTVFELKFFLFGLYFKLSFFTRTLLLFTSFIWLVGAVFSIFGIKTEIKRYWILFYLTYLGNYLLIFSYDIIGFYLFFSLMSFSAFGLIMHSQTKSAKEAAFSYIKFAVFGEILLFLGVVYLFYLNDAAVFSALSSKLPLLLQFFIITGFGVKVGMFLLHPWLPKAHAQAPGAVSALLSGVMLKTGVLGWIQFLNLGTNSYELLGYLLVVFGFLSLFGGIYGIFQKQLKQVLAYSSISQMGYLVIALGMGLIQQELWSAMQGAVLLFILHHGFVKAALFLTASQIQKEGKNSFNLFLALLGALLLIGVPFSSGALSKIALKDSLLFGTVLFSLSSFVTAGLMMRFLFLTKEYAKSSNIAKSFIGLPLYLCSFGLSYIYFEHYSFDLMQLLPLAASFVVFAIFYKKQLFLPIFPTGDIANCIPSFSFQKLQKPLHEKRLSFQKLQENIFKAEKLLKQPPYSFILLLAAFVGLYLLSSL